MKIAGAIALVTGASSGIGRATALELARRGATVILTARTAGKLDDVVAEITSAGGKAHAWPVDLSDAGAVESLASQVIAAHGTPDIVVNNAGAGRWLAVEETPLAEALQMAGAPYLAAFYVTRAFLPSMIARRSGWFVQVNSPACFIPIPGATGYSASRAALRTFDDGLGLELRGTGIGVTHLVAGETSSEYFANNPGSHARIPGLARIFRVVAPIEVAQTIAMAIQRERRHVSLPLLLTLTLALFAVAPWMVRWMTQATSWRRPRG